MIQAFKGTKLKPTERLVAFMLADHMNDGTGRCDPSIPLLAEETGLDSRSIIRAIQRLEETGNITVNKSGGRRHSYKLHPVITPPEPLTESHPCHKVTPVTKSPLPPSESHGHPCQRVTPPLSQSHPNHNKPEENHKLNRKEIAFALSAGNPKSDKGKPSCKDEVLDYAEDQDIPESEAETFWDMMEAGGWMRGKAKLKDWKAHLRTYHGLGYLKPKGFKPVQNSGKYGNLNPQRGVC